MQTHEPMDGVDGMIEAGEPGKTGDKPMQALRAFGLDPCQFALKPFGSGHINKTYLAHGPAPKTGRAASEGHLPQVQSPSEDKRYVLQQINTGVFKRPEVIAANHRRTWEYLAKTRPDYLFLRALPTADGQDLWRANGDVDGGVWRLMPYVPDTITLDRADSPKQAYEAARQFGRFARYTAGMDLLGLEPTIPDFHNLTLRVGQFEDALAQADVAHRARAGPEIEAVRASAHIATRYAGLMRARMLPERLMHHDTKINNVLLGAQTYEGVCVVDLDTLMPGVILSDLGDMVRTYVCPVSEEEQDVTRVCVREDYFAALMDGYVSEMRDELTRAEKDELFFAGQFMIYMQAVRFLADYLNGDVYYPVKRPEHNLDRARNQIKLLQRLNQKEQPLKKIIQECL